MSSSVKWELGTISGKFLASWESKVIAGCHSKSNFHEDHAATGAGDRDLGAERPSKSTIDRLKGRTAIWGKTVICGFSETSLIGNYRSMGGLMVDGLVSVTVERL